MFFDGVVATDGNNSLVTYQTGELVYNDKLYVGKEILALIGILNDQDIEDEVTVDIHVDKFFVIKYGDALLEDFVYCDFDEALKAFEDFLKEV
jgi:hypothetical protein